MATKTLYPNATGSVTQLRPNPSGTQNYIDCQVNDGDSSYVDHADETDVIDYYDLYNLDDSGLTTETINSVTVHIVCRNTFAGEKAKCCLKSGAATAFEPPYWTIPSTSYTDHSYTWTTDPNTGLPWTPAAVDALQAGVLLEPQYNPASDTFLYGRCTQVYVVVDYTPLIVAPPVVPAYPGMPWDYERYPEIPPWKPRRKKRRRLLA